MRFAAVIVPSDESLAAGPRVRTGMPDRPVRALRADVNVGHGELVAVGAEVKGQELEVTVALNARQR
jgi:hypothetical protein